jgi:hypothetical protein
MQCKIAEDLIIRAGWILEADMSEIDVTLDLF